MEKTPIIVLDISLKNIYRRLGDFYGNISIDEGVFTQKDHPHTSSAQFMGDKVSSYFFRYLKVQRDFPNPNLEAQL
jgi:hypothetical protein